MLSDIYLLPREVQGTNQGLIIKDEPHSCSLQRKRPQESKHLAKVVNAANISNLEYIEFLIFIFNSDQSGVLN